MKISIPNTDALKRIKPSALNIYANGVGWKAGDTYRKHSTIFTGDNLPEIIIPKTKRLGDYSNVVFELIKTFASVSGQSEATILRTLTLVDRDIVRMKTSDNGKDVSLKNGITIIQGLKDLLSSAARSYFEPKQAGVSRDVNKFMETVKLKPPEEGSFVLSLITESIAPDNFENETIGLDSDPTPRLVMRKLSEALTATRHLKDDLKRQDKFQEHELLSLGVSVKLCSAIESILKVCEHLEIQVTWAKTRPVEPQFVRHHFEKSETRLFNEAVKKLRQTTPNRETRVVGLVNHLKRDATENGGRIKLNTQLDNRTRSVQIELEQQDYEHVVEAHRNKSQVAIEGNLELVGSRWHMRKVSGVEIISQVKIPLHE
ncbi:MAG: hypothetical protein OXG88_07600 [Gammaproteobacteria bacterium]|nr:hypothetical protein [Gammaproteobacteria bacterium]